MIYRFFPRNFMVFGSDRELGFQRLLDAWSDFFVIIFLIFGVDR